MASADTTTVTTYDVQAALRSRGYADVPESGVNDLATMEALDAYVLGSGATGGYNAVSGGNQIEISQGLWARLQGGSDFWRRDNPWAWGVVGLGTIAAGLLVRWQLSK